MNYCANKRDNLCVGKVYFCVFVFALLSCYQQAKAETIESLGEIEREVADFALAKLDVEMEPNPKGKRLRAIRVVNLPVFTEGAGFLEWFNVFHVTTRESIIAREVLLRPGEIWNEKIIEETKRGLSDPVFTSAVVVLPIKVEGDEGLVDLLVGTRDVWSLRVSWNLEFQGSQLTLLQLAPSELNLLGRRKAAQLVFIMTQGNINVGPTYEDKNILGRRLQGSLGARLIYSRARELEGSTSAIEFGRPLFSLRTKWGFTAKASHLFSTVRQFQGTGLRPYDNPDTPEVEAIPWQYRQRNADASLNVTRSFGTYWKHNLTLGYGYSLRRQSLVDGFPNGGIPQGGDVEVAREAFTRDALPRSERSSGFNFSYNFFEADFKIYRDLSSFSLAENFRAGPFATVSASIANKILGSQRNFALGSVLGGWRFDIKGDGFLRVAFEASTRLQSGEFIDNSLIASTNLALPHFWILRPNLRLSAGGRFKEQANRLFAIGGDSGLRGFQIGEFVGLKSYTANVELRTLPITLWRWPVGATVFWDGGHAANRVRDLSLRHNVGIGFRVVFPEFQAGAFRVDWALPLNGGNAGLPGRFSAGFGQVF